MNCRRIFVGVKMLRNWDDLPDFMRTEEVRPYYEILKRKKEREFIR